MEKEILKTFMDKFTDPFICPYCQNVFERKDEQMKPDEFDISTNIDKLEKIIKKIKDDVLLQDSDVSIDDIYSIEDFLKDLGEYMHFAPTIIVCNNCYYTTYIMDILGKEIFYPEARLTPLPNEDLPYDIKADYEEASVIVKDSPRGACALLRLALQKLMIHLGEDRNLDKAIQSLIDKNKIDETLRKALDSVRVIGNNATHPNELDIKDNHDIAIALFKIINYIAEKILSNEKQISEIYELLPESAKRENRKK